MYDTKMTRAEFIEHINAERLANKGKWHFFSGIVDGVTVQVKNYNTYLQYYSVNGRRVDTGAMDMSATAWKAVIANGFRAVDLAAKANELSTAYSAEYDAYQERCETANHIPLSYAEWLPQYKRENGINT